MRSRLFLLLACCALALPPSAAPLIGPWPGLRAQPQAPDGVILPTRDLVGVAQTIVDNPTVTWSRWRFISFAAAEPDNQGADHAAVRYVLATLSRGAIPEPARSGQQGSGYLQTVNANLWAVDATALGWPAAFWDSFNRSDHYYGDAGSDALRTFFRTRTGTERPVIRSDDFVANAWEPSRYAAALAIPQTKDAFIQTFLGTQGLATERKTFGVVQDRLTVAHHPGQVGRFLPVNNRPVWMRVLHADETRDAAMFPGDTDGDHVEFIWQLPNGLDGYASYDRTDRLALTVPTTVSKDSDGGAVRLGHSCLRCHTTGIRSLDHAVDTRKLLLLNLNAGEFDKDKLVFSAKQDQKRWAEALAGFGGLTPDQNAKAVARVTDSWGAQVTSEVASRELGVEITLDKPVPRSRFGDVVANAAAGRINRMYLEAVRQRVAAVR